LVIQPTNNHPPEISPRPTLLQQCGLTWPQPALSAWPPDTHLALAVLLAVPVCTTLGLLAGPAMYLPSGWAAWMSFVLVYPVVEELLFRGVLQGEALRLTMRGGRALRIGPVSWANVLVTLAFVAMHLIAQPLVWALAVTVPSLVFGHLRERFASVWPPMLVHVVYNAGFGLAAWLA
jgi:membrane protease YdiL (CAAX protease family)